MSDHDTPSDGELLVGAPAISRFLGVDQLQIRTLRKELPIFLFCNRLVARKAALVEALRKAEAERLSDRRDYGGARTRESTRREREAAREAA